MLRALPIVTLGILLASGGAALADQRTTEVLDLFKGTCATPAATTGEIDSAASTFWSGSMQSFASWDSAKPDLDRQTFWKVKAPTGEIILKTTVSGPPNDATFRCEVHVGQVDYDLLDVGVMAIMKLPPPTSDSVENHTRLIKWVDAIGPKTTVEIRYGPDDSAHVIWLDVTRNAK